MTRAATLSAAEAPASASQFALHEGELRFWTGEFASREMEDAFIASRWPRIAAQMRIVTVVEAVAFVGASIRDYLAFGYGDPFLIMGALRLFVAAILILACYLTFKETYRPSLRLTVFLAELAFAGAELAKHVFHVDLDQVNLGVGTPFFATGLLLFYTIMPNRMIYTLLASAIGSVLFVVYHFADPRISASVAANMTVTIISMNALGYVLALSFNRLLRPEYLRDLDHAALQEAERAAQVARAEADRANRAKSHLLAIVSHEMRMPLTGIAGSAQLLRDQPFQPEQQKPLEIVSFCASQLAGLVDGVLDLVMIEQGRQVLKKSDFELNELLNDVKSVLDFTARNRGLKLTLSIAPDVPRYVHTDPVRLRQILFNLADNGLKYTREGEVSIKLERLASEPRRALLGISIRDTGPGLSAEEQSKVFLPYYQVGNGANSREGIGLGLSICSRLIEMLGGEISLASTKGQGSTFSIKLWLDLAAGRPDGHKEVEKPASLSLMIAEDSDPIRYVATSMLQKLGHRVVAAWGGEQAVELATEHLFDAILMDIHMPDMDGLTATRKIRALSDSKRASVPIIAVTADTQPEQLKACLDAGIQLVLTKPIQMTEISRALAKLTQGSTLLRYGTSQLQATVEPAVPLLDLARIASLEAELGAARFEKSVLLCRESIGKTLDALLECATTGDTGGVKQESHRLSGLTASFGMVRAHDLAKGLSRATPEGSDELLSHALETRSCALESMIQLERRLALHPETKA